MAKMLAVCRCIFLKQLTMVLLWHSRQTSGLLTLAQLLCLLQLHSEEQLFPTKPKWHWQTPGDTHVPFTQPCAHTGSHCPERLYKGKEKKKKDELWVNMSSYNKTQSPCLCFTCWVCNLTCRCNGIPVVNHGSPECCCSDGGRWCIHPLGDSGGKTNCRSSGDKCHHSLLNGRKG